MVVLSVENKITSAHKLDLIRGLGFRPLRAFVSHSLVKGFLDSLRVLRLEAYPALGEPEPRFSVHVMARHAGLPLALSRFPAIFILGTHDGHVSVN